MNEGLVEVTCPTCFETFEVLSPPAAELPADVDYDCEICCRPMRLVFSLDSEIGAVAVSATD